MPLALNVIVVVRLVYHTAAAVTVEALWLRKQLLLPCSISRVGHLLSRATNTVSRDQLPVSRFVAGLVVGVIILLHTRFVKGASLEVVYWYDVTDEAGSDCT